MQLEREQDESDSESQLHFVAGNVGEPEVVEEGAQSLHTPVMYSSRTILPPPSVAVIDSFEDADDPGPLSSSTPISGWQPPRRQSRGSPPAPAQARTSYRPLPSVTPCVPEHEILSKLLEPGPVSEKAPVSTWRPKQKYPSYAPPAQKSDAVPARAFAIKVLDNQAELVDSHRLRYQIFESLNYLQRKNRAQLEIDEYDRYSIPFGAFSVHTGELVGTLRLITNCLQMFHTRPLHRLLDTVSDAELRAQAMSHPKRLMPSIISGLIEEALAQFNTDAQTVEELSRTIVHPKYRGSGVSRGLMEFGLAYAMTGGDPVLIGGCVPNHVPMYAKYGYSQLPGTDLDRYDTVGQIAHTVVCNTRILPEPTRSRVRMIMEAMRVGEPECILEESVTESGGKSNSIYHFAESFSLAAHGAVSGHARHVAR